MEEEERTQEDFDLETKKQELLDSNVHVFLREYQKVIRGEKSKAILSALDYVPGLDMPKAKAVLKKEPIKINVSRKEVHRLFLDILGLDFLEGQMMIIKKEPPKETFNLKGFVVGNPGKTLDVDQTSFYLKSSDVHFYLLTIDLYLEPARSTLMAEVWEIRAIKNSHVEYDNKQTQKEKEENTSREVVVYAPPIVPVIRNITNERKNI